MADFTAASRDLQAAVASGLALPPALAGEAANTTYASAGLDAAARAFVEGLDAKKLGLEFYLAVLLDPLFQEAEQAYAAWQAGQARKKAEAYRYN